jgi:hypothetical protein
MTSRRSIVGAILGAALGLSIAAAPSTAYAAPTTNQEALSRLGGCIAGGGEADMLLLIDRSGSLKDTDPGNARVAAAKYVVRQMSSAAKIYGWKLNVAIAGFDTHYELKMDWRQLTDQSLTDVATVIDGFGTENHGQDTDYWQAMDHARGDLSKRMSGQAASCPFVVWFTDGEYSINRRTGGLDLSQASNRLPYDAQNNLSTTAKANAALEAGKKDLCRPGGIADQIRSQGITTLAIGLNGGGHPDFGLLKGIATGSGMECGGITSPAPGAFYTADDIDGLYAAFDAIAAPGRDPVVQESGVCATGLICLTGSHPFVLDGSIGSVHGLASTGAAGQKIIVTGPSGEKVEFAAGGGAVTSALSGAQLTGEWVSDRSVSFDLKRMSDAGWTGEWSLAFVAPNAASGTARSSLHLFGDLLPSVADVGQLTFRSGSKSPDVTLGLARADGSKVDPASVTSAVAVGAAIVQGDQSVSLASGLGKSDLASPVKADLGSLKPGPAVFRVTLDVTTTPWTSGTRNVPGTKLETQTREYAITILPPGNYPTVPATLDFGATEKSTPVGATIKLSGAGCAWLDKPTKLLTGPDGVQITVSSVANSRETCSNELPLVINPSQVGNGLVSGTLTVQTLPGDKSGDPVPAVVAFTLDMKRPADALVLWGVLAGVMILGIAIPVGLLYLLKFITAVIPGESVAYATVRGQVSESTSFVAGGVPITVENLSTSVLTGASRRRVAIGGGKTLVAKVGLVPTEPGYVVVEQPGLSAGGGTVASSRKGKARLPLAVQGHWCVALDPVDPLGGPVEVSVFTAVGGAGLPALLDDVRGSISEFVAQLRESLPQQGARNTGPARDEWGSTSSSSVVDEWTTTSTDISSTQGPTSGGVGGTSNPGTGTATRPSNVDNDSW